MIAKKKPKQAGLTFFDKLVLWLNYAMAAALLIGYLAPIIDPRTFWPVAFFGLAYPPVLLINIIFIIYWLFRKAKWALLSTICILAGWQVLNNNIGLRAPASVSYATDSTRVRVMTYNVHDFRKYGASNDLSTKREILEIIEHQQPDLMGFEEFYSRKRGQFDMVDSIKKIFKSTQCYYMLFNGNVNEGVGMAIFSKYPIVNTGIIWLTGRLSINQCLYADIKKNGSVLRFYAVHLQSIRFDPEDYRYLEQVASPGAPDVGSSRRIGSKLKRAFLLRAEQVKKIKQHMSTCPYPYIVAGDFNDTPSSYAVNLMAMGLKNAFREKGSGMGRTYNGNFPNYQIDYVMASPAFEVLNYGVIRKKLSDHYPIYSDLRLSPPAP